MLLALKEKVSGWVAYVIVGLIAIPFAFWGIQQYFGLLGSEDVVVVEDMKIQLPEFEALVAEKRREYELASTLNIDDVTLRGLVARDIVSRAVLDKILKDTEYMVSEASLKSAVVRNEEFWQDGGFDRERYVQILKRVGLSPASYENRLQRDLEYSTFIAAIRDTGFVLPNEERQYTRLVGEERDISYVFPVIKSFVVEDEIKEIDLVAFFDDNKEKYRSSLMLKLKYVELNFDDLLDAASVTTEQVTAYYAENKVNFTILETRSVRTVTVESNGDGPGNQNRARQLRRKILHAPQDTVVILEKAMEEDGNSVFVDFVEDLQEYDIEDEAMREDIFSLHEGGLTNILKLDEETSQFFIIEQVNQGWIRPLDEVYQEIQETISREEAGLRYTDTKALLEERSYELQDEFWYGMDESFGLEVYETGWLSVDSPQAGSLLADGAIKEAIGRDLSLLQVENSPVIEVFPGRKVVIFRIEEVREPRQKNFFEVNEQVRSEWINERSQAVAQVALEEKFSLLASGQISIEELIKQSPGGGRNLYELEDLGYIGRVGAAPIAVLEAAFSLPKPPSTGFVRYGLVEISPRFPVGAVVSVFSVKQPQAKDGGTVLQTTALLARDIGEKEISGMLESVRASMDVSINEALINSLP